MAVPLRFNRRGAARIAAHDVFRACGWGFVELEFDVPAVAVLVRPADRHLRPDGLVQRGAAFEDAVSRQAVMPPRRQQKLTVRIPCDLADAMKRRALDQRTSVRQLLLLALQKDGYAVEAADLLPGAGGSD